MSSTPLSPTLMVWKPSAMFGSSFSGVLGSCMGGFLDVTVAADVAGSCLGDALGVVVAADGVRSYLGDSLGVIVAADGVGSSWGDSLGVVVAAGVVVALVFGPPSLVAGASGFDLMLLL